MAEEKQFIDKAGLEAFWASVENALTRMYQNVPEGMQIARVYQQNGRLHVAVEDFGGSTETAKKAARASLNVGIYYGSMEVATINQFTTDKKFNHGDIVTASDSGDIHNPGDISDIHVSDGDSVIRNVIGDGVQKISFWKRLAYTTHVKNEVDSSGSTTFVTSVTQEGNDIKVKSRDVGLNYHNDDNRISFG